MVDTCNDSILEQNRYGFFQKLQKYRKIGMIVETQTSPYSVFDNFLKLTLFVILIILVPFNSFAEKNPEDSREENSGVTYGGEVDFNSRYVWRGIAFSEGVVMQPSAWISISDFAFSIWSNFVLDEEANQGQFNEIDLVFAYNWKWNKITIEPALQFYLYPNQEDAPTTGEVYITLSYAVGPIQVITSHNFDIVEYEGSYFGDVGISYEREFHSKWSLEASWGLGWGSSTFNEVNLGLSESALEMINGSLSLSYHPVSSFYFRPHIEFSRILDENLRSQVDDPTIISGGLAFGMEF
jgi:hypothetical protein